MNQPKHILIIPSWYPKNKRDIVGSFFREQAIALHKAGYKVGVIKPEIRSLLDISEVLSRPYGMFIEKDSGINTFRFYSVNITPRFPSLNIKRWIKIGKKLYSEYVLRHGKPDIIHVHSLIFGGFLAQELKRIYSIPFVVTEHSSVYARKLVSQKLLDQLASVVGSSSTNIAVSNEFKLLLSESIQDSIWEYIPNIVHEEFLKYEKPSRRGQVFYFVTVCYLTKNKNVSLLIKSFAKAFKGKSSVRLRIGGDGEERRSLFALAKELDIDEQIEFLGELTRNEVKEAIANADAFVLPSQYETFGVVVIEALALGKPVISTKCGGPESIIVPEVGYLVDRNSVDEFSQAMLELYKNKNKFQHKNIKKYCIENFSEYAVLKQLSKVYDSVLALNEK